MLGWLRDSLWLNSSQLLNGIILILVGMNSLSVRGRKCSYLDILFGLLDLFMFFISCRGGYWQEELIETLAWAHERTPLANLIGERTNPVALSFHCARLVGLAYFSFL